MKKELPAKSANITKVYETQFFKGVDYSNTSGNVNENRAAYSINMIRDQIGKVRKRTGFKYDNQQYNGAINGVHYLKMDFETIVLIHAGTTIYKNGVNIYSQMQNGYSQSVQIENKLYIVDGKNYISFDGSVVEQVKDNAYTPTVYENRLPTGGGDKKQPANILTSKRSETFIADGISTAYKLSQNLLDNANVQVQIKDFWGNIKHCVAGTDYNVDTVNGIVNFNSAPVCLNIKGQSNVFITYNKTASIPKEINGCRLITVFGKGGRQDVLVLGGNDKHKECTWFSYPGNPYYFPEESVVSNAFASGKTIGYSIKDDMIFTHLSGGANTMNIIVRKGVGNNDNDITYPVVSVMYAPDSISEKSFKILNNEPLFLTSNGVYGLNSNDYNGEAHTQLRSLFINNHLLENSNLENASATIYNDFYVLSIEDNIYLLDGLQKSKVVQGGFSDYQYECYHWKTPKVSIMFVENGQLCFGTQNGKIGRFYNDYTYLENFNDEGKAIHAVWQTADVYSDSVSKDKKLVRVWVVTEAAVNTSFKIFARFKGVFKELFTDDKTSRYFSWSQLDWSKFTWSCDKTPKLCSRLLRSETTDKMSIRIENNILNQPFGIQTLGFEYLQGNYFR